MKEPENIFDLENFTERELLLYQAQASYKLMGKVEVLAIDFGKQRKINEDVFRRLDHIEERVDRIEAKCPEGPDIKEATG